MKQRLRKIIDYAAGGRPTAFAQAMGWTTQYLNNLLNTDSGIGIKPVISILEHYPEINARWLLLGTGAMLTDISATTRECMYTLLSIEKRGDELGGDQLRRTASELALTLARLQGYLAVVNKG